MNVVHVGIVPESQSDVDLAQAFGASIVGFNVRGMPCLVSQAAGQANIKIILHSVIYHLLKDIGELTVEKAPGTSEIKVAGEAQLLLRLKDIGRKLHLSIKIDIKLEVAISAMAPLLVQILTKL